MGLKAGYRQTEVGMIPDAWLVKSLGELKILMTNGFVGPIKRHYTDHNDGVLYIQGYNVEENHFNFHGIKFVTEAFHRAHRKSCLQSGDLLTVQTGDVGLTAIVPESLAGSNCHALVITRFDQRCVAPAFISFYLNSKPGRSRLRLIETGTTMKHLNVGDLLQFSIPLPPTKAEQEAVAEALCDADAHIESLEQLLVKKRNVKQGAMQELLRPKFGWTEEKLGNIAPLQRGFDLPSRDLESGPYPVVYSNGVLYHHKTFMVKGPGLVTGRSGTLGVVQSIREDFWPHNTTLWVTDFKGNDPKFIYYLYAHIGLDKFGTGSGVPTLNRNDVHDYSASIPSAVGEQVSIASVLSGMDAEIAVLEATLAKARMLKRGMMQELLTGRIRLL